MGDRTPECGAVGQAQMLLSLRGAFHLSYLHTNFPKRMKVSRIADYVGSSIGLILNNDLVTKMNTGYIIKIFSKHVFLNRWNDLGGCVIPTGRLQV